jgi:predicted Zn-dependent peptidase
VGNSDHQITELESGIRVATEAMPSVRSVALGFWIGVGSRHESAEQAGISHFLEHLLFKGTQNLSSTKIDELFDEMGAEVNAGTGKEMTSLYSRFLDQHLDKAFDAMADMVFSPAYADLDAERQVVIEEIAMYEDEPSDKVHDVLASAMFGDHPLGRPIIGSADVISSVPLDSLSAYHDRCYGGSNVVVAASGNVDHDRLCELVSAKSVPDGLGSQSFGQAPAPDGGLLRFHRKDTEQAHLCIGAPGIARGDQRRFALRVLDTILGGSTSSRLFQEVREKRGLAYAVFSYVSQFLDCGQFTCYVGTRPDNIAEAIEVVGQELKRVQSEPVTEAELVRGKENVKGRTVLAMESTLARVNRLGTAILGNVPLLDLDETLAAIDAVTLDEVTELATELFDPSRLCAAGVGPDEGQFRGALESISPILGAA